MRRMVNATAFARIMKEAGDQIDEVAEAFRDKVGLQIIRGVVMKTPVLSGRARGGWQVTYGEPAVGQTGRTDTGGNQTVSEESENLLSHPMGGKSWITNNVVYIERLEHGHSQKQAPNGMVGVTLAEVDSQFS